MKYLTDVNYWKNVQGGPDINLDNGNLIEKWISIKVDFTGIEDCFEIGCYPGRYLSIFAKKGIEINGLDYIEDVNQLPNIFRSNGYKVGEFYYEDFLKFNSDRKFDCVFSLGFIEHFQNWEEVFIKHLDLVKPGGIVIIEVPNFRGWFQFIPRFLFDRKNFKLHNLHAMRIKKWKKILESKGFEITFSGYMGGYLLWFEGKINNRFFKRIKKKSIKYLSILQRTLFKKESEHYSFSAALGIIARKR
ncbi:MAG TPA: methyltransferase domain-containing protein [Hanamia sp.]